MDDQGGEAFGIPGKGERIYVLFQNYVYIYRKGCWGMEKISSRMNDHGSVLDLSQLERKKYIFFLRVSRFLFPFCKSDLVWLMPVFGYGGFWSGFR